MNNVIQWDFISGFLFLITQVVLSPVFMSPIGADGVQTHHGGRRTGWFVVSQKSESFPGCTEEETKKENSVLSTA